MERYASIILMPENRAAEFCIFAPKQTVLGFTSDPVFSVSTPSGWQEREHLEFLGIDGTHWVTKCHATYTASGNAGSPGFKIWFSSGVKGMKDHDGEFPIFRDAQGRYWRLVHVNYQGGEYCGFGLEPYHLS